MAASRSVGMCRLARIFSLSRGQVSRSQRSYHGAISQATGIPPFGQNDSISANHQETSRHRRGHLRIIRRYSSNTAETESSSEPITGITENETENTEEEPVKHNIIQDSEVSSGDFQEHEFQAETRMLLDIVAKSLYSENEVFIRELVSNASDALEKLRYLQLTQDNLERPGALEIHIATNQDKGTFAIQDTGVGMNKEEMVENLGTIARSGSKAFLKELQEKGGSSDGSIIGQFGVGFYSAFMVGDKVEVFSKSHQKDAKAWYWCSDGSGKYEMSEADGVMKGTKIVIHLKKDCWKFGMESDVKDILLKHSNFVGVPIFLNGTLINTTQALWTEEPRNITEQNHTEFYQYLTKNTYDTPRYTLHFKADAPLNIRSLFYVPNRPPAMWEYSQQADSGVSLYSRKILIQHKAEKILPKWLRFVVGVVDSEDIPLNLSRELLQDSALIRKLRTVLTTRLVKFFTDQAKKDPAKYDEFTNEYSLFLREGIVSAQEQSEKEEIARLLRYESSALPEGQKTSLIEYGERMKGGERNIYYICAPSRELAEGSPYFEAFRRKDREVIFCYDDYDEITMLQLREFDRKLLRSVESEMAGDESSEETSQENVEGSLTTVEVDSLVQFLKGSLGAKVNDVKVTQRLGQYPAMITVAEMGAARHFLRTAMKNRTEAEKMQLLQPTLELNGSHPIIKKLFTLKTSDPDLAKMLAEQIYDNGMIAAGLVEDPRPMLNRFYAFMEKSLEKY
ncbi:heat shock protein 75 kDa, mitochondrial-like [Lytechinus variegatus]|uniref:heat shock protein 75 kDa, mitochondrial-like n=1 Tax=Lytechinus variegatus TaxID=7654 RepID=UPI001BB16CD7|nr:heat shock protein 75 kDa, mitochondrial-like [Lytechinus variegatus]